MCCSTRWLKPLGSRAESGEGALPPSCGLPRRIWNKKKGFGLVDAAQVSAIIDAQVRRYPVTDQIGERTLAAFRAALRPPRYVTVNFAGGITRRCWSVTRGDGCYRLFYLPWARCFSLCVESDLGPLDIGVHGDAIPCFDSV